MINPPIAANKLPICSKSKLSLSYSISRFSTWIEKFIPLIKIINKVMLVPKKISIFS